MAEAYGSAPGGAPESAITLELSQEEAQTLHVLTARIGGDHAVSPRRHANKVKDALTDVLGDYYQHPENQLCHAGSSIRFNQYPTPPPEFRPGDVVKHELMAYPWLRRFSGTWVDGASRELSEGGDATVAEWFRQGLAEFVTRGPED